jgi:hypothetical protein
MQNICRSCGSEITRDARFCPSCGAPVTAEPSAAEAEVAGPGPGGVSTNRKVARILLPLAALVGGILVWNYINPSVNAVIKAQPVVSTPTTYGSDFVTMTPVAFHRDGEDLVFSLSDVKNNRLVRFEYTGGATPRPIMAYIGTDGRLVTAISISDHCGSTEFKIKDNKIYCAHCPSYWDMMTMEAYACCGRYYPDPIPSRVVGDEVRIDKAVVEKWAGRM